MASNSIPPLAPRGPYLDWCTAHSSVFTANATAIGLTAAKCTAYATLLTDAVKAVDDVEQAKSKYRAAVVTAKEAMRSLSVNLNGTGELVRTIRAFAESQANPDSVYSLAQIDPPASAAPLPAPNPATDITVGLEPMTGAIMLKWKAAQPGTGTVYVVKRRVNSTGSWEFVGTAGSDKTFVDVTFPAGPDSVQYSIQAQRSNLFSETTGVVVNFGVGATGPTVQTVKLAA
jgi:hypothetical protein